MRSFLAILAMVVGMLCFATQDADAQCFGRSNGFGVSGFNGGFGNGFNQFQGGFGNGFDNGFSSFGRSSIGGFGANSFNNEGLFLDRRVIFDPQTQQQFLNTRLGGFNSGLNLIQDQFGQRRLFIDRRF